MGGAVGAAAGAEEAVAPAIHPMFMQGWVSDPKISIDIKLWVDQLGASKQ